VEVRREEIAGDRRRQDRQPLDRPRAAAISGQAMITFELEADTYWIMRQDATSLPHDAAIAVSSATRVPETTRRRVTCSRSAAEALRDWLTDRARAYLAMAGEEYKAPPCRRAAETLDAVLRERSCS
jgi:hypothetical protein